MQQMAADCLTDIMNVPYALSDFIACLSKLT